MNSNYLRPISSNPFPSPIYRTITRMSIDLKFKEVVRVDTVDPSELRIRFVWPDQFTVEVLMSATYENEARAERMLDRMEQEVRRRYASRNSNEYSDKPSAF